MMIIVPSAMRFNTMSGTMADALKLARGDGYRIAEVMTAKS